MMGLEATAGNPIRKKRKNKNEVKAYSLLGFPLAWWTLFFVLAFFSALIFSFTNVSLKSLATGSEIKFTLDNYKNLPLGIVPMLALCDAWLGDVNADLTAILGMYKLRKTASVVHIHLHGILELLRRKIR